MKYPAVLIGGLAVFSLVFFRIIFTGHLRFGFIVANIVLAAIPLFIQPLFSVVDRYARHYIAKALKLLLASTWLLFLPNAFYILTDFMYLNPGVLVNRRDDVAAFNTLYARGDGLYTYDTLLILGATVFGAYVGGLALLHAYKYFKRKTTTAVACTGMGVIMLLSAIGVYIGRFGRWNSWEGITQPFDILVDLSSNLINIQTRERFLLVVLTIVIFQLASLLCLYYSQKVSSRK